MAGIVFGGPRECPWALPPRARKRLPTTNATGPCWSVLSDLNTPGPFDRRFPRQKSEHLCLWLVQKASDKTNLNRYMNCKWGPIGTTWRNPTKIYVDCLVSWSKVAPQGLEHSLTQVPWHAALQNFMTPNVSLRHVLVNCFDSQHGQLLCVVALAHLCRVQVRTQPPVLVSWRHLLLACLLEWIFLFKSVHALCGDVLVIQIMLWQGESTAFTVMDRNDIKRAVARTYVSLLGSRGTWAHGCLHGIFYSCHAAAVWIPALICALRYIYLHFLGSSHLLFGQVEHAIPVSTCCTLDATPVFFHLLSRQQKPFIFKPEARSIMTFDPNTNIVT